MADGGNDGEAEVPQSSNRMQVILREVMMRLGVDPADITAPNLRFQNVRYAVWFMCEHCRNRRWTSSWGWFTVDLNEQRIKRRFKQCCVMCATPCRPLLRGDQMTVFAETVVRRYITFRDQDSNAPATDGPRNVRFGQRPHRADLCEKCEYGARPCWLPRNAQ